MTQQLTELAMAKPVEVADFAKCLAVAVAGLSSDQVDRGLASKMRGWLAKAQRVEAELGLEVLDTITTFIKGGEVEDGAFAALGKQLRSTLKASDIHRDPKIPHGMLDLVAACARYFVSESPRALTKVLKLAVDLHDPDVNAAFVVKPADQKSFVKPLQKIVKAATGKEGQVLTAEEQKKLKAKFPKLHKEYLHLRKQFNESWRMAMRQYIVDSGKKALSFQKVVGYLEGKGLKHTLPKGFEGLIDANGKLYTTAGKLIKTVPGPGFSVAMNPEYDPKKDNQYVFTTVNDATGERSQHVYTVSYSKGKTEEKFTKVRALSAVVEKIHAKWIPYMRRSDKSPQCVASTMLDIIMHFSARIGSMANATAGAPTFGLSTLLVRNLKVKGQGVALVYSGKDAVKQIHLIDGTTPESKLLVKNLKLFAQGKDPKDFLFTFVWNDREARLTGNMVNKWFAKLGAPEGVTVHKLRHTRGTQIFQDLLKEHEAKIFNPKKPLTQAQADAWFKKLATAVGEQLGHVRGVGKQQKVTGSTAIANYLDPTVMVGFYVRLGLRPPKFLAKFL
jgi:integrase